MDNLILSAEELQATADIINNYAERQKEVMDKFLRNVSNLGGEWRDDETFYSLIQEIMKLKSDIYVKVDKVKVAMDLITLDTVSQGDILTNAVSLYSELNEEQRALLTQEEIQAYDKFSTVSDVVSRLFEINDDIVDQYGKK